MVRDPRFENTSGTLNQGLFAKSYSFIKEMQQQRQSNLKEQYVKAKNTGDKHAQERIKEMMAEEKILKSKLKKQNEEHIMMQNLKKQNKQRVLSGQEPVYAKKREIKELKLKDRFD